MRLVAGHGHRECAHWVPYLDGVRVDAVAADTDEGWVEVLTHIPKRPYERRYGRVELLDTRTGRVVRKERS